MSIPKLEDCPRHGPEAVADYMMAEGLAGISAPARTRALQLAARLLRPCPVCLSAKKATTRRGGEEPRP